jgi:hypothetical protein
MRDDPTQTAYDDIAAIRRLLEEQNELMRAREKKADVMLQRGMALMEEVVAASRVRINVPQLD